MYMTLTDCLGILNLIVQVVALMILFHQSNKKN